MSALVRSRGVGLGLLVALVGLFAGCGTPEPAVSSSFDTAGLSDADGTDTAAASPPTRCPGNVRVCALRVGDVPATPSWLTGPLAVVGQSPKDIVMTNGLARYVIRGGDKGAAMYGTTAGHLVDAAHLGTLGGEGGPHIDPLREVVLTVGMHIVRPDVLGISEPGGDVARVKVFGPLVAFPTLDEALSLPLPKLKVTHEYVLRAGSTALEIITTLAPDGVDEETALIADVMFWGGEVALYLPGFGDQTLPITSQSDTVGLTPRRPGGALNAPPFSCAIGTKKKMSTIDAGAIKAFLHGNVTVPTTGLTVRRFVACGGAKRGDLAAAMASVRRALDLDTVLVRVTGRVEIADGAAVVEVLDKDDKPLTRCDTNVNHLFDCQVPLSAKGLRGAWLGDGGPGLDSGGQLAAGGVTKMPDDAEPVSLTVDKPARLVIRATRASKPLPVRVTLRPTQASGQRDNKLLRRIFADEDGAGDHLLPPGAYDVYLNAGPFSAMHHQEVVLKAGVTTTIERELPLVVHAPGWIAADLHVHAEPSSDSSVPVDRRLAGAVVEGVDYVVATDHDTPTDYRAWIPFSARLNAGTGSCVNVGQSGGRVLTAIGEEVSTLKTGHFNVWPVLAGPDGAVAWFNLGPEALLKAIRGGDPARVVQCNHPRFEAFSYFKAIDFRAESTEKKLLQCDLMELINGIGHKETAQVLIDWLGLLARGVHITATGTSDCHGTSDFIGNPRTWVYLGAQGTKDLCAGGAAVVDQALKAGRAIASAGPLLITTVTRAGKTATIGELLPSGAGEGEITVRVAAPEWLPLGTVEVYVGQTKVLSQAVGATPVKDGARDVELTVALPGDVTDTSVVAVHVPKPGADGWPGIHRPAWAIANPVRVDGDNDGKWFGQP